MLQQNFIVYIIGTTAAGKTKLSLNLGQGNYEIISADSMQLYKEADIMTAKATPQEQAIIKHHGLDLLNLNEQGFNRSQWREKTLETIQEIHSRGKIPVIVGGTHYYIESLLFNQKYETNQIIHQEDIDLKGKTPYEYLSSIDPLQAQKFHQNDIRRIMNSIKYYHSTNQLPSTQNDHHSEDCQLRNLNFLIFWPKWSTKDKLKEMISKRINEMIMDGGLEEIIKIFKKMDNQQIEEMKGGVLQSIGYRQFQLLYKYYEQNKQENNNLQQLLEQDEKFKELFEQGKQQLINDTVHYTKKQVQWIKNRIICNNQINQISNRLFLLEFDDAKDFTNKVIIPAQQIYQKFLELDDKINDPNLDVEQYGINKLSQQLIDKCILR